MNYLKKDFFARDTITVARDLLGKTLVYKNCSGIIVETEAYKDDAASHAVTRPNKGIMLHDTYGHIYIYFIYGMYHCLNFTTEKEGTGAVLIRAIQPLTGFEEMRKRRAVDKDRNLTNGPGKLFQAFGFSSAHHGEVVGKSIKIQGTAIQSDQKILQSPRIGISKAKELEWRFFIADNEFVSR